METCRRRRKRVGPAPDAWRNAVVLYLTGSKWWSGTLLLLVTRFGMLCWDAAQPLHVVAMLRCTVLLKFSFILLFEHIRLELWNAAETRYGAQLSLLPEC